MFTIYGIIQEQMIYVITVHTAPYSNSTELKQMSKTEVAQSHDITLRSLLRRSALRVERNSSMPTVNTIT